MPYWFEICLSELKEMLNGWTYFIEVIIVCGMDISIGSDLSNNIFLSQKIESLLMAKGFLWQIL